MMRNLTRKAAIAAASAAVIGGGVALSAPAAFADTPAGSLGITINNPAAATVTITVPSITIDATQNISQATAAPGLSLVQGTGGDTGTSVAAGSLGVTVQTNNQHGYAVNATGDPNGMHTAGQPNVTNADLHLTTVTAVTPSALTLASTTMDNTVTVISDTGPSGGVDLTQFNSNKTPNTDSTVFGFWVLPNSLLGGLSYSSTVSFVFVPTP